MEDKNNREIFEEAFIADSLIQEFEQTLPDRVQRYLQVKPHGIVPNTPFASASSECSLLFRDGHFYACIALVQAVTEAIVRYMCDVNFKNHDKVFEKNLKNLHRRNFIDDEMRQVLLTIWDKRNDYHHLNSSVESDRRILAELAMRKAGSLARFESEIFAFETPDGTIAPKYPQYWKISGGKTGVFLRLMP